MRVVANGLIYRRFADDTSTKQYVFRLKDKPKDLMEINLGIDFGGSGSGHSFYCYRNYKELRNGSCLGIRVDQLQG